MKLSVLFILLSIVGGSMAQTLYVSTTPLGTDSVITTEYKLLTDDYIPVIKAAVQDGTLTTIKFYTDTLVATVYCADTDAPCSAEYIVNSSTVLSLEAYDPLECIEWIRSIYSVNYKN
jgi:hypothetical protein